MVAQCTDQQADSDNAVWAFEWLGTGRPPGAKRGVSAQPAPGRSLFGGGADRGVVLGGQVLDALGVRCGPGGCSAVVVAEPARPNDGVH